MPGQKVRLEPPRVDDAPTYARWHADRQVTRYLPTRHPPSVSRQRTLIERAAEDTESVEWTIARASDGAPIGSIGLQRIEWRMRNAEIAYVIGERSEWRNGYATEAVRLATGYAFRELALHKTLASVIVSNVAARRALEKNGYRESILFRRARYVDGEWLDLWVGEILCDEWETSGQGSGSESTLMSSNKNEER